MAEQRWIPVDERLPEGADGEYVLVTDGNVVGMATHRNGWSHAIGRDGWTPTHWMPLPEPPAITRDALHKQWDAMHGK